MRFYKQMCGGNAVEALWSLTEFRLCVAHTQTLSYMDIDQMWKCWGRSSPAHAWSLIRRAGLRGSLQPELVWQSDSDHLQLNEFAGRFSYASVRHPSEYEEMFGAEK